jgi:hypothetical protein
MPSYRKHVMRKCYRCGVYWFQVIVNSLKGRQVSPGGTVVVRLLVLLDHN